MMFVIDECSSLFPHVFVLLFFWVGTNSRFWLDNMMTLRLSFFLARQKKVLNRCRAVGSQAAPQKRHLFPLSKNRGNTPKVDGENNGKPYFLMDDLGGKPTIFGNTHVSYGWVESPTFMGKEKKPRAPENFRDF